MNKYLIILIALLTTFIGCSDEKYESLNIDHTSPSNVPSYFLVTNATTSLFDQMVSTNVNLNVFKLFAQYYTEVQYTDEANYDLKRRGIPDNHWGELYRDVLYDLQDAKGKIENDGTLLESEKANQIAITEILQVYAWQVLVDTFGNVPYTEALQGLNNQTPVYDDAKTIYIDIIGRLKGALSTIDTGAAGFGPNDIIYNGDMNAWKKVGASLLLRLGVQVLDQDNALGTDAIQTAYSMGVFTSNSDNFVIQYLDADPYKNPIAVDINSRNDFVPANTIVDMMNTLGDPRREFYFDQNMGADTYIGGVYGAGSNFSAVSHLGELLYNSTNPGDLLDYAEVEFLLAEAASKGISSVGSAEVHYNNGIMASMEYWGVSSSDAAAYLALPNVAFASAPGTDLQKIANQFWLAMFNRGFEGWNVWRRLDAPVLASPAPISGLPIPMRYTYPTPEQTLNRTNYQSASSAIGGDEQQTKVFWDVN